MKTFLIKCTVKLQAWKGSGRKRDGFGKNEILGIAAALIIAAFVIIPGLKGFAQEMMDAMGDWWDTTVHNRVFPLTP